MTAPIHKTCYRCEKVIPAFVDPADEFGGQHGVCVDCRLVTAAAEVAREWRMAHPEQFDAVEAPASPLVEALALRYEKLEAGYKSFEDGREMTDEQLAEMNAGLGLTKGKDYRPYCLRCAPGPRVALRPYGFECWHCGNRMSFGLRRLADIPRENISPTHDAAGPNETQTET